MTAPFDLSSRITTCADAFRFLLKGERGHDSSHESYKEVMKFLPSEKASEYKNTNLVKAALDYFKQGLQIPTSRIVRLKSPCTWPSTSGTTTTTISTVVKVAVACWRRSSANGFESSVTTAATL